MTQSLSGAGQLSSEGSAQQFQSPRTLCFTYLRWRGGSVEALEEEEEEEEQVRRGAGTNHYFMESPFLPPANCASFMPPLRYSPWMTSCTCNTHVGCKGFSLRR